MEELIINNYIYPINLEVPIEVKNLLLEFSKQFLPYEIQQGSNLCVFYDVKSKAYYICCHLEGKILVKFSDLNATIESDNEDEIYKLNREITQDQTAYKMMEKDASEGRSFEDIVLEYSKDYKKSKPLKVYGGQHRITAIAKSGDNFEDIIHGVRIYFSLNRDQKVEIATVNNTAIAVPNDLLDRMREQLLGSELRKWCQKVGLLEKGQDFADRRNPEVPTVRIVRTLLVNFIKAKENDDISEFQLPTLCKSGGIDTDYLKIRETIDWNDPQLIEMGKQFERLNQTQRKAVSERTVDNFAEFARKALSLSVVAGWSYAAGLFQNHPDFLKSLYSLPDKAKPPEDPLNAKALSIARHKGIDPDTYRGLGTRNSSRELGRMLEVFLVYAQKNKDRINKDLANAAIQSFEAKKSTYEASKVLKKI
jgi:predicted CopG family antitoxin